MVINVSCIGIGLCAWNGYTGVKKMPGLKRRDPWCCFMMEGAEAVLIDSRLSGRLWYKYFFV